MLLLYVCRYLVCKNLHFWTAEQMVLITYTFYPASMQCRATIGPPAKHHLNGVSLVGQWWPSFRYLLGYCLWTFNTLVRLPRWAGLSEPWLVTNAISTKASWARSDIDNRNIDLNRLQPCLIGQQLQLGLFLAPVMGYSHVWLVSSYSWVYF